MINETLSSNLGKIGVPCHKLSKYVSLVKSFFISFFINLKIVLQVLEIILLWLAI